MHTQPTEVTVSFEIKSLLTRTEGTCGDLWDNVGWSVAWWKDSTLSLPGESLGERTALSAYQVTHLLDLCLWTTYFLYKGEYYQQEDGAAMGSPVAPVVANIDMEMFEDLGLKTKLAPRIWKRYKHVDDILCVIEEVNTRHFLNHLNSLCPSVQFFMEKGLKYEMMKRYLSAVYHLKVRCGEGDPRLENMPLLEQALRGTRKEQSEIPKQTCLPIIPWVLMKMNQLWSQEWTRWNNRMLWVVCFGFTGFLYLGELTASEMEQCYAIQHCNSRTSVDNTRDPTVVSVHVQHSNHIHFHKK